MAAPLFVHPVNVFCESSERTFRRVKDSYQHIRHDVHIVLAQKLNAGFKIEIKNPFMIY